MEFHHAHLNDKDKSKFHEIIELMEQNYNHVEYRKEPKGAWVSIIYCIIWIFHIKNIINGINR